MHPPVGRNVCHIEVQLCGTVSHLRLSRHPPLVYSDIMHMDWGFSSGQVAAAPVVSRLISAGSAMEICFQISVVKLVEVVYTYFFL